MEVPMPPHAVEPPVRLTPDDPDYLLTNDLWGVPRVLKRVGDCKVVELGPDKKLGWGSLLTKERDTTAWVIMQDAEPEAPTWLVMKFAHDVLQVKQQGVTYRISKAWINNWAQTALTEASKR